MMTHSTHFDDYLLYLYLRGKKMKKLKYTQTQNSFPSERQKSVTIQVAQNDPIIFISAKQETKGTIFIEVGVSSMFFFYMPHKIAKIGFAKFSPVLSFFQVLHNGFQKKIKSQIKRFCFGIQRKVCFSQFRIPHKVCSKRSTNF